MPDPFKRDPNVVPDVDTTRGRSVSYEDTSFVTGDSPVVLDVNTDLSRNGRDGYVANDGSGNFTVEISDDGSSYGGVHTIKEGEVLRIKGMDIDKIRISWVADSAYRVFVA
jgi:uncharacterized protein YdeI (BOF family)